MSEKHKGSLKGGEGHDAIAEKIMRNIETGLVNKRNATAQALEPSLGLNAEKSKAKPRRR